MQSTINTVMTRPTTAASDGKPMGARVGNKIEASDKVSTSRSAALSTSLLKGGWGEDLAGISGPKLVAQLLEQIQTLTKSVSDLQARAGVTTAPVVASTAVAPASGLPGVGLPGVASTARVTVPATTTPPTSPPTFASRFPPVAPSATAGTSAAAALPPPTFANRFPPLAPSATAGTSAATAVSPEQGNPVVSALALDEQPLSVSDVTSAGKAQRSSDITAHTDLKTTGVESENTAADTVSRTHEPNSLDNLSILDEASDDTIALDGVREVAAVDEHVVALLPDGYVALSSEYVDVFDVVFVTRLEHQVGAVGI